MISSETCRQFLLLDGGNLYKNKAVGIFESKVAPVYCNDILVRIHVLQFVLLNESSERVLRSRLYFRRIHLFICKPRFLLVQQNMCSKACRICRTFSSVLIQCWNVGRTNRRKKSVFAFSSCISTRNASLLHPPPITPDRLFLWQQPNLLQSASVSLLVFWPFLFLHLLFCSLVV